MATRKKTAKSSELAIPEENLLVDPKTNGEYFEIKFDLQLEGDAVEDETAVTLAGMKLLASMSKEVQNEENGAKPGRFWNTLTQEAHESFTALPLYRYIERYRSLTPGQMGSPNVCVSRDGRGQYGVCSIDPNELEPPIPMVTIKDPRDGSVMPVGDCANCPHRNFSTNAKTGEREKPTCREVHYLVCLNADSFEADQDFIDRLASGDTELIGDIVTNLYTVPFARTGMNCIRAIQNMSRLAGGAWYSRMWTFSSELAPDQNYKYYVPVAKMERGLDRTQKIVARSISHFIEKLRGYDRLHALLDESEATEYNPQSNQADDTEVEVD